MEETKKCPYCGEEILAVAKKCKFCGEWLNKEPQEPIVVPKATCPVCGEVIDADAAVCPYCKEPVKGKGSIPQTPTSSPKTIQSSTAPEQQEQRKPAVESEVMSSTVSVAATTHKQMDDDDDKRGVFQYYVWDVMAHHYADFKGRMSVKRYWLYILLVNVLAGMLALSAFLVNFALGGVVYGVLCMGLLIPSLAAVVRRLHDTGRSGATIWIGLIPLVGPIWLLILLCQKGESDTMQATWMRTDWIVAAVVGALLVMGIIVVSSHDSSGLTPDDYSMEEIIDGTSEGMTQTEPVEQTDEEIHTSSNGIMHLSCIKPLHHVTGEVVDIKDLKQKYFSVIKTEESFCVVEYSDPEFMQSYFLGYIDGETVKIVLSIGDIDTVDPQECLYQADDTKAIIATCERDPDDESAPSKYSCYMYDLSGNTVARASEFDYRQ